VENQDPKHLMGSAAGEVIKASRQQPTRVAFVLALTATRDWRWEGVVWQGRLYLEVPTRLVQTGSKEGFVALLEYAEEQLRCTHVLLALSKDRQDRAMWCELSCSSASLSSHRDTVWFRPTPTTSSSPAASSRIIIIISPDNNLFLFLSLLPITKIF